MPGRSVIVVMYTNFLCKSVFFPLSGSLPQARFYGLSSRKNDRNTKNSSRKVADIANCQIVSNFTVNSRLKMQKKQRFVE